MVWTAILRWGVVYGLLFSACFTVVLLAGGLVARDFAVHSFPPAIRERYGPKSRRGRQVTAVVAALIAVLVIGVVTAGMLQVRAVTGELGFVSAFATAAVIMHTFNIVDLLVLDWLVFVRWQPGVMVLPGTEGMPEYRDLRFHFDGFVKGLGICTVIALIAAATAVVVQAAGA
jgi:hypothetical protein